MNGLGCVLVWSAVPSRSWPRRLVHWSDWRRVAGRWPARGFRPASLLVIVVLTPLAICGLPQRLVVANPACWTGGSGNADRIAGNRFERACRAGRRKAASPPMETGQDGCCRWSWWASAACTSRPGK